MGWYYNPPQPTQLAPHVVQASTGQNPPIKGLAATAAAILTLWPVGYDHSAYAQNYRPKQTAPLTLAYGAQPPVTSLASFYARRSQWIDPSWSSPQSPPEAAITPRVDNPPLQPAAPVFIKDPARPIYGLTWQYGTQNAKGGFSGWSAPPPAQAPPIIGATAPDALASWANPTWPAQDLSGPVVQPYLGDEPPGVSSSATDLAAFGYYDGWPSQRLSFAATVVQPPVVSAYIGPSPFPYTVILSWQSAPTWGAQTQGDVQPLAGISYGSQPPPSSTAKLLEIRSLWSDPTWAEQSQAPSASIVQAPATSAPPPSSIAGILPIWASWNQTSWSAQSAPDVQPLAGIVFGAQPPPTSIAVQMAVRSNWTDATWGEQSEGFSATTAPAPIVNAPPPSGTANLLALLQVNWPQPNWLPQSAPRYTPSAPVVAPVLAGVNTLATILSWPNTNWSAQTSAAVASWISPAQVVAAQPYGQTPYAVLASWSAQTWPSQTSSRLVPMARIDAPQPRSLATQYAVRLSWAEANWPAQSAFAPVASNAPPPAIQIALERIVLSAYPKRVVLTVYGKRFVLIST